MTMRVCVATAGLAASLFLLAAPAGAADCKDPLVGKARSSAQVSDAERVKRATENAIGHWRVLARQNYGWRYRFWSKAVERNVRCTGGASAKTCTVTAKPCKLLG